MISIYDFTDYRVFLNSWIDGHEKKARGLKGKMAEASNISSTLISLILKGEKQLSLEQALEVAAFIGLNDAETDYFFLLVELARAGTHKLQSKMEKKIREAQEQAKKISKRVKKDIELSDELKAIYYSSWIYTGIRNLSAIEGINDARTIAERLNLPLATVSQAIEFLVENGLCKRSDKKITYGAANTHIASDSPYVVKHHQNWRVRGFTTMDYKNEDNLFYTCPMSLSKEAAIEVRKLLPKVIDQVLKIVGPSTSEEVYCFNLDWFEY